MEKVYTVVRSAKQFSVGGVGLANTRSQEEQAFRELLTQPGPVIRCRKLLSEGTPAGQMYGLLGLRLLDRKAFQAALPAYKNAKTGVATVEGCLVMDSTISNVVRQIEWTPAR